VFQQELSAFFAVFEKPTYHRALYSRGWLVFLNFA
jgi:hypothetical protein